MMIEKLSHDEDLTIRFVHVFGRAPEPAELKRFQRARGNLCLRLPARARRRAATIIAGR